MNNLYDGITVVDFTATAAGPHCTALMADYGAEVIKIEKMGSGDESRFFPPMFDGTSFPYMFLNRGKKSIVVDLADPEGLDFVRDIIKDADVVLETFKPGAMAKLGLGYEDLKAINPRIIFCSISLNGQTGPKSAAPGYDAIAQGLAGLMNATGFPDGPPIMAGYTPADYSTSIHAFASINAALYYREKTGVGQAIDLSLVECLASFNSTGIARVAMGINTKRGGNQHPTMSPFGIYEGNGGSCVICAPAQSIWNNLCKVMGRPELANEDWCKSNVERKENRPKVDALIEEWLKTIPTVEEAVELMEAGGVACGLIADNAQILQSEQLNARGMIYDFPVADGVTTLSSFKTVRSPLHFSALEQDIRKPPNTGQHLAEVLKKTGRSDEDVARLTAKWLG